jgi:hypothetical protein
MSMLPRVTEITRERVAREFDDLGPDVCLAAIERDLRQHNPELLDMAIKWTADADDPSRLFTAFAMFYRALVAEFYRLLMPEARAPLDSALALSPLPFVTAETRGILASKIHRIGGERFTREAVDNLESWNPELLQMAHAFASDREDYARTMQGFALFHEALLTQFRADKIRVH